MERGDSSFLALNMSTKKYVCVSFDNAQGDSFPFPLQSRIKIKQVKYLMFHVSVQTWAVLFTERLLGPEEAEPATLSPAEGHPTVGHKSQGQPYKWHTLKGWNLRDARDPAVLDMLFGSIK